MAIPELTLESASPEVKRYQRLKIGAMLAGTLLSLLWMAVVALAVGPAIGQWLTGLVGDQRWPLLLGMAVFLGVTFELFNLPLDFWSGYLVEHRYQLSNQTVAAWLWRRVKGYLVGGVLGMAMLAGLYALLWTSGSLWWVWATVGWLVVSLVLGKLLPVVILPLFYRVSRLEDAALLQRLRDLTHGTTLTVEGVYRLELSKDTKKANAALAGLGNTRRGPARRYPPRAIHDRRNRSGFRPRSRPPCLSTHRENDRPAGRDDAARLLAR